MALDELRRDIEKEARSTASQLDREGESEAKTIIGDAKRLADDMRKKAIADAHAVVEQRKRDALIAVEIEVSGILSNAREESVDSELVLFKTLIAKRMRGSEEALIKYAIRNFLEIVPKSNSLATVGKKYAHLAEQQHIAKIKHADTSGIILSSLDGRISADASVDGLIETRGDVIRGALSKAKPG
jgi:vacuolar-type H+-ATPase subunit E/Vma4